MALDLVSMILANDYTDQSLLGGGSLVGKNVTISSITPITGGNRVTFSYTLDNGTVKTSTMDVMDGKDGIDGIDGTNGKDGQPGSDGTDGIGISKIEKIGTVDLVDTYRITFTDNSTFDYEVKNGADGQGGSGGSSTDEKVKLDATSTDAKYLNELIDNATIEVDAINNCLVVKKIEGQTATIAEINFLTGVTSNIQTQIDNLGKSMTMYGVFGTKADLLASTTPQPVDGNTAIVIADEDNDNKQMTYIYIESNSDWTRIAESSITVRDFTTDPIDLSKETIGTLPKTKIDTAIARLVDVLDKTTYKGTGDGIVKQADKITGLTATIEALNKAVTDSHTHSNKAVLDKIVSNGIGSEFLSDNGNYVSILHIDTVAPTYNSQIWIDITTETPILKIYDGIDWVSVGGGSNNAGIDDSTMSTETCWSSYKTNSMLLKSISLDYTTKTITVIRNDDTTIESDVTDFITSIINGLNYGNAKYCNAIPTVAQDGEGNWIATYIDKADTVTKTCNSLNTWFYYDITENDEKYTVQTLFVDGQEITIKAGSIGDILSINKDTKHWIIQGVDSGIKAEGEKGETGTSISNVSISDDKHLIITYSDNTTQDVGLLKFDIHGDFLTSDGFGNLRYFNDHFQYYDESSSTWIDTSVTPSNVYIMNMTPQPMKKIFAVYDTDLCKYKLKFEEPDDTVIDGQVACIVEKVIIRRKLGAVPISETDGELVLEIKRKDFGTYKNEYFVDTTLSPSDGEIFYYKAFPMSTTGFYNTNSDNETDGIRCKDYNLYGFKLDQNESDPASMITYLGDCDNKYYESAKMNYTTDTFNYGDWGDAWFIKNLKPCMLRYDGTVDYELNKNDYTKKLDGTNSDIANISYGGNAMVGIPKVYWKIVNNGDNTANIYICDKKIDSDFHCWSHIDNNGNEIDYCYLSAFDGCNINSKLRSISGQSPMTKQTGTTEINYAKSNNTGSDIIWYTGLFNDWMLINILLFLIGKSTDSQTTFGTGNNNTYVSASNTGIKKSGTMNTKGLFWGSNDNASGVKVFGIENFYGNVWKRIGGWINDKGTQKIKITYGQSDGSTVDGYNTDGNGYIVIGNSTPIGTSGGYIGKVLFNENGLIPTTANGSQTTYYCDGLWFNNSQVNYALVGGRSGYGFLVGAFCSGLSVAGSGVDWCVAAALSCKPLATT